MNNKLKEDKIYLQRLLRLAGYYNGKIDGIVGTMTQKALDIWEKEEKDAQALYGIFDARTENNLTSLLPVAQRAFRKWFSWVQANKSDDDIVCKVICGTRTYQEQEQLYAQGRTKKGAKVTNAKAGYSFHNFGLALDIGLFTKGGAYIENDKAYIQFFKENGVPDGFSWGGNWTSFKDYPHIQLNKYGDSASKIRSLF